MEGPFRTPPGPERRDRMAELGWTIGPDDFTDEERSELRHRAARLLQMHRRMEDSDLHEEADLEFGGCGDPNCPTGASEPRA